MKRVFIALLTIFLSGCWFSTPNSNFYLLESVTDQQMKSEKKVSIAVQDIYLPEYLQKPQIVLQKQGDTELKISEFNRWASDLDVMFQNTLIEDLQKMFPNATVKPLVYGSNAKYVLKINVEKMSGYFKQTAYLSGVWQILSANGAVLKSSKFSFEDQMQRDYASYVKTQSILISKLADEVAAFFK